MKFTVMGSNQRRAVELKLDFKDLAILEWMQNFWPKMKKRIIDKKEFGWVNYATLLSDYPLLEIKSKRALYDRMQNLVKIGLLEHRGIKDKTGSFSYYRITEMILQLVDDEYSRRGVSENSNGGGESKTSDGQKQNSDGVSQSSEEVSAKLPNKDKPIIDSSIISLLSLEETKKHFLDLGYKSDPEAFWLHWLKKGWKDGKSKITDRGAAAADWERIFKKFNPSLYVENKPETQEAEEIKKLRGSLKHAFIGNTLDHDLYLMGNKIEKRGDDFFVTVEEKDRRKLADKYGKIFEKFNVKLEIK